MKRVSAKERILEALKDLPEDATFDDAIETVVFLARIEEGLVQVDRNETLSHADVKERFDS